MLGCGRHLMELPTRFNALPVIAARGLAQLRRNVPHVWPEPGPQRWLRPRHLNVLAARLGRGVLWLALLWQGSVLSALLAHGRL